MVSLVLAGTCWYSFGERSPRRAKIGPQVIFRGVCDASGAVPLNSTQLALADDEDNRLRVYDTKSGGPPLRILDVTSPFFPKKEADLEAAASIGQHAFWLSSHGRNKKGKLKQERLLFFSTSFPTTDGPFEVIGTPYRNLLDDLLADPRLTPFDLARASQLPPKEKGGLNLEGMTATPENHLLLGFRSPTPHGKALVVPLENPLEVPHGATARLGAPLLLDLGGLGIRSLSSWRGRYLIVAGPYDTGPSRLFGWLGPNHPPYLILSDLRGLNPEGFFTPESRDEILLLSDDGALEIDGTPCKSLPDSSAKRFRGLWVDPGYR